MAKTTKETTALVVNDNPGSLVALGGYLPIADAQSSAMIGKKLRDNLAGEKLQPSDLTTIKVPSGDQTFWSIPTIAGPEMEKEIRGIIIHMTLPRARWEKKFGEGDPEPPICYSRDSEQGHGNPGILCDDCQFSDFGSSEDGIGQACKQRRMMFILREGEYLPSIVSAPPGSLKVMKKFLLQLVSSGLRYDEMMIGLTLQTEKSRAGIKYPQISPRMLHKLDQDVIDRLRIYADAIRPVLDEVRIDQETASE